MASDQILRVSINTPNKIEWEGEADAVSSENSEGPFDVLPGHANFITLVRNKPVEIHRKDGIRRFQFVRAVIYVKNDEISVYGGLKLEYGNK